MFTKYLNQFGKAEAEWAMEVLDMHGGDETAARLALVAAVDRIIFDRMVDAACFAAGDWWNVGLRKLRELGKIPSKQAASGSRPDAG